MPLPCRGQNVVFFLGQRLCSLASFPQLSSPLPTKAWQALPWDLEFESVGAVICSRSGLGVLKLGGGDYEGETFDLFADATLRMMVSYMIAPDATTFFFENEVHD